MSKLLFSGNDWDFPLLDKMLCRVEEIGRNDLGMNLYPNQVEIISADQMLDAYSSHGMPVMYNHWSFGKRLIHDTSVYRKGHMGLAYEIIINCAPAIAYLMEENSATMQLLVLAHASVGHNFCFANNYMFKTWTDADAILDYLNFAKQYVIKCEERYGVQEVEQILDHAHALQTLGVDKHHRARKLNARKEAERQKERLAAWEKSQNHLWYVMDPDHKRQPEPAKLLSEPEDNLLYFLEKHSPTLQPWQREILRIVRKLSQYWYPQMLTKTVNEGIATFTHHYILNKLYDQNEITDNSQMEWMMSHANVVYQPSYDHRGYSGMNPYALGFAIFRDIKRMCEQPTSEDAQWFPKLMGADWREVVRSAATEYRDDAFISQWLSPKVSRDFGLFHIHDDKQDTHIQVNGIQDPESFEQVRYHLSQSYDLNERQPQISVTEANLQSDRLLQLKHVCYRNQHLDDNTELMLRHVQALWGHKVRLTSETPQGDHVQTWQVSDK